MHDEPSLSEVSNKMREDLDLLREAVQRETDHFANEARTYIQQHPYAAVGAAFGVGFLLAGGLFSRATARGISFGARFFLGRAIRQLVGGAAAGMAFPSSRRE
jgi:glycine zipper-containing protein DUF883